MEGRDMKPERIEELARLAYEAPAPGKIYTPYEHASRTIKEYHRKLARTLYAAAMRDAAGVARDYADHVKAHGSLASAPYAAAEQAADEIATAIRALSPREAG
jgi:hypothetical protein